MTCATQGCPAPTAGNSKYCREHKAVAREQWLANVRNGQAERAAREAKWADLFARAHTAGESAAAAHTPAAMVVQQRADVMDDTSPVVQQWVVPDGVCGFAWVKVRPGNCSFALWLKKHKGGRTDYYGGIVLWVSAYNQSMEKKLAYARAFAGVVKEAGVDAYADYRLD